MYLLYFSNNEVHHSTKAFSYNVLHSLIFSAQKLPETPCQLSINILFTGGQLTVNSRWRITVEKEENS